MPDYTIASQVKIPDSFATLGNMVNTARGITELQKSRATLDADITRAKAESSSAVTGAEKARQALPLEISRLQADSEKARTGADEAALALKARNENIGLNLLNAVRTNPAFINGSRESRTHILDSTEHFAAAQGLKTTPGGGIDQMRKLIDGNATPEQITQAVDGYIQMLASPEAKATAATQVPQTADNGQQLIPRPNPYQVPPAQMAGGEQEKPGGITAPIQKQLPPNTETVTPEGQRAYVGAQPSVSVAPTVTIGEINRMPEPDRASALKALQNQGRPQVPASAPPSLAGTVETIGKDWDATQTAAKSVGQDIGVLQNIKKYAHGAITGVETDRRAYLAGVAGLLGIDSGAIGKTSTDLLIKNSNMQALGGNTDAARILLEGANPNIHMTKEAIVDAANQVIAQRKMVAEKQRLLLPIKSAIDSGLLAPSAYNEALAKINRIDPRVFQLSEMDKAEKKKMMDAMTSPQQAAFIKMVRDAHELGMGRE